jgi:hypothetical protein
MKTKKEMYRELLRMGISKARIKSKDFSNCNFTKFDFSEWDFSQFFGIGVNALFNGASFYRSNFTAVDFSTSYFSWANFENTNFDLADFSNTNFSETYFVGANFHYTTFRRTNFNKANFIKVDFRGVDFTGSNINFNISNFEPLVNETTIGLSLACPEEGAFIAYKKCVNDTIVKLQICEDAKRSSATTLKCRASKALVLEIEGGLTEIASKWDESFIYRVGEIVEVTDFDENRWDECSKGIHFFLSKEVAKQYI